MATLAYSVLLLISISAAAQETEVPYQQNRSSDLVEALPGVADMQTVDLARWAVDEYLDADDEGFDAVPAVVLSPDDLSESQIADSLWLYLAPSLLILGTAGNCLTFIVLQTRSFRNGAIGFALSALTVVDTSLLWTSLLRQCLLSTMDYDVRILNVFGCKTHFFATCYLSHLSSWTVATLSVERALSIGQPYAVKLLTCSRRRIVVAWSVVAIVLAIINLHFFWNTQYIKITYEDSYDNETVSYNRSTPERFVDNQSEQDRSYFTPWEMNYPTAAQSAETLTSVYPKTNIINSFSESSDSEVTDQLAEGIITSSRLPTLLDSSSSAVHRTVAFDILAMSIDKTQSQNRQVKFSHSSADKPGLTVGDATVSSLTNGYHSNAGDDSNDDDTDDAATGSFNSSWAADADVGRVERSFCFVSHALRLTIWHWADNVLFVLLPFVFIITSNLAVIWRLWRSNSVAKAQDFVGSARARPITSSTMMLMAVSAAFLLTTTPLAVHLLGVESWLQSGDAQTIARIRLSHSVCSLVYYAGSSVNFLLYCFSGSRFRRALRETLTFARVTGTSNQRYSRARYSEYACSLKTLKSLNSDRKNNEVEMLDPNMMTNL